MLRRDFLKAFTTAAIGAALITVPAVETISAPAKAKMLHLMSSTELDQLNYIIQTRMMPRYIGGIFGAERGRKYQQYQLKVLKAPPHTRRDN